MSCVLGVCMNKLILCLCTPCGGFIRRSFGMLEFVGLAFRRYRNRQNQSLPAACCQVTSVVSDSVQPHGLQPTRLLRPWDSPGKNTGVGCHFLLQCMKVESESEITQSRLTLSDPMDCSPPGSSIRGIFQARVLDWVAIAFSNK